MKFKFVSTEFHGFVSASFTNFGFCFDWKTWASYFPKLQKVHFEIMITQCYSRFPPDPVNTRRPTLNLPPPSTIPIRRHQKKQKALTLERAPQSFQNVKSKIMLFEMRVISLILLSMSLLCDCIRPGSIKQNFQVCGNKPFAILHYF